MKKTAFTLAEVLLVLGIIGIIASVTIPAVTTSNQNKKFSALAKKAQLTLQGAIDNKMGYTLSRPKNDQLFIWLTDGASFGQDTIKYVKRDGETITTPDGMVFYAAGDTLSDGKLRYGGLVYVDLNGAEGPTQTTVKNGTALSDAANSLANFDVIAFRVTKNGDVIVPSYNANAEAKTKKYLGL